MTRQAHKGGGQGSNQYGSIGSRKRQVKTSTAQTADLLAVAAATANSGSFSDELVAAANPLWTEPDSKQVSTSTPWGQAQYSYQFLSLIHI